MESSHINEEFKANLTQLLNKYLATKFSNPVSKSATASTDNKIDLTTFEKLCQSLAVKVTEYESNKQILNRIRRSVIKVRKCNCKLKRVYMITKNLNISMCLRLGQK